ncbi:MAG: DUF3301 domain-containing protein [Gammaproteobacteria bacterium]|jgi:hypothetical protein|nr:DUF3301 domain-containing protein [Gammaproteobacteria bacterium]MBT4145697.1 DUF3301 domain-containing protein [Gammaproteobacteria bacterium]MBT5221292.1 DUF3301 domain-containing protein [Gammaproteobacteria bacterium]MBT5826791.1 DUF3301 domain-containing protein [Gammaproteobacteria bacterium]MBT5967729.1 DUF3301 domain-containing protein [Gammaproteobacteria bacterium]
MWTDILMILLFTAGFLYWQSTQKIKEIALAATIRHCQKMELQMLDGYIAFNKLSLKRDSRGKIHIARGYQFEFSSTGAERYNGQIQMLGRRVEFIRLEPYRIQD